MEKEPVKKRIIKKSEKAKARKKVAKKKIAVKKVKKKTKIPKKVKIEQIKEEKVDISSIKPQIIEKSIDMEKLDKAVELWVDPKMQFVNLEQSTWISREKTKEKQDHVVNLHIMWLTNSTILEQINKASEIRWWGTYKNINSIQTVINKHFKDYHNPNEQESKDYLKWLKESAFAQQESISETTSIYIKQRDKKDDWKPFEKIAALKELYLMKQQMVDNRNFNESKFNTNSEQTINNTQINVFMDNSKRIAFWQIENPILQKLKDKLTLKYNDSKDEI